LAGIEQVDGDDARRHHAFGLAPRHRDHFALAGKGADGAAPDKTGCPGNEYLFHAVMLFACACERKRTFPQALWYSDAMVANTVNIPDKVRRSALAQGEKGRAWMAALPQQIAAIERAWNIRVGATTHNATEAYVASPRPRRVRRW